MSEPSSSGVSVCLIVKNCADSLRACLESLQPFLRPDLEDEIVVVDTGSTDTTPDVARAAGAQVHLHPELSKPGMFNLVRKHLPDFFDRVKDLPQFQGGFIADFAGARNLAHSYARHPIHFWIDSDDILEGDVAQLRLRIQDFFATPENRCLFLQYDYNFEDDGQCNTVLWRERILRFKDYHWKGVCHESVIPNEGIPPDYERIPPDLGKIVHKHGRGKDHIFGDVRNYAIMKEALDDKTVWRDPRLVFYAANACRGLAEGKPGSPWYARSSAYYEEVLFTSGSREDRLACALNLGYTLMLHGRPYAALKWFDKAIEIYPFDARAYYAKARAAHDLEKYAECLLWTQIGRGVGIPALLTSVDPLAYTYLPMIFELQSLRKMKNWAACAQVGQELQRIRPGYPPLLEHLKEVQKDMDDARKAAVVHEVLSHADSSEARREIVRRLAPEFRKSQRSLDIEVKEPVLHKHVSFLCGTTVEPWDASSLATGIGGSEKMVILISRELARRGWKVTVYGSPKTPEGGTFDGVEYLPAEAFNSSFRRDIIVLWRAPHLLECVAQLGRQKFETCRASPGLHARKVVVDLHDVVAPHEFTPDRLRRCSGLLFKSKYHAEISKIPEEFSKKIIVSRNAVDLDSLPASESSPPATAEGSGRTGSGGRNYNKVLWTTSADRGLKGALKAWDLVKGTVPEAELHVYYGFTPLYRTRAATQEYQYFGDHGHDRHMSEYQEECLQMIDYLGATYHGRVSHDELQRELSISGVWLYPTKFPEISCLSAMEAQLNGCLPVVSDYAALKETVQNGIIVEPNDPESVANAVVGLIQKGAELDSYRAEMQKESRERFSLTKLVDDLEKEFA
jgi:glycosyltransferase involved in cell wall biosynthesis